MAFGKGELRSLAHKYGWQEIQDNVASRVLGFSRYNERINVYYTTGTVGTCTDHPRLGNTQLFRRNVSLLDVEMLFCNIRTHTGKGYYRRHPETSPEPPTVDSLGWWGFVDNSLLNDFDPDTTPLVALGDGYFAMTCDGEPYWQGNLPVEFTNKLRGRQSHLPRVDFVAFGPGDTYFVQFANGQSQWNGASKYAISDAIHGNYSGVVHTVAFAPGGGYYIKFEDGSSEWNNLPLTLHNQLNGRQKSLPDVDQITIGPEGEWFVRFENGDWRCNGHPDDCDDQINKLQAQGHTVEHIAFGHNYTWLITYS